VCGEWEGGVFGEVNGVRKGDGSGVRGVPVEESGRRGGGAGWSSVWSSPESGGAPSSVVCESRCEDEMVAVYESWVEPLGGCEYEVEW
jgi:hypothetical protein